MTKKAKKLVVGNWKMNPATLAEAKKIAAEVKATMRGIRKTQAVMCPPFVYLSPLSASATSNVLLGTQDAFYETAGPYTGEVSYSQLHQFKVSHVIIGHSERRVRGETDEMVNKKVRVVVGEGMTAIICVGERTRDQHGDYFAFIREQILSALKDVSKKLLDHVVIAYEPVWAIGASAAMTPQDLHEMSIFIRKTLKEVFGTLADGIAILYGGSVNAENALPIVRDGFVQGLLVGRDSLKPKEFAKILKAVDHA